MVTINQLVKGLRGGKKRESKVKALEGCPQKLGVCIKVYITKPRKPNSALRKVTKVRFFSTGKKVIVGIPGIESELMQHSIVLVRGGRMPDTPGVKYKLIKGKADFSFVEGIHRGSRRSKFGAKRKFKKEEKKEYKDKLPLRMNKDDLILEKQDLKDLKRNEEAMKQKVLETKK